MHTKPVLAEPFKPMLTVSGSTGYSRLGVFVLTSFNTRLSFDSQSGVSVSGDVVDIPSVPAEAK